MARIRMIKPELFTDKKMAQVEVAARFLFVGLWTLADREGRLVDAPNLIAGSLFPFDLNISVDDLLNQLVQNGQIQRYTVDGESYIQIHNFTKHQNPHPKEKQSVISPAEPCKRRGRAVKKVGLVRDNPDTGIRNTDNDSPAGADSRFSEIVDQYNSTCVPVGLPKCLALSGKREGFLNARIGEHPTFDWPAYFTRVSRSKFLCGGNDRGWRADFEWLVRPENFLKVNEGKYDNRESVSTKAKTQQDKDDDAILDGMRRRLARSGVPE